MHDPAAFLTAAAELVDAIVADLKPDDRLAMASALDDGATLRLAVNMAPAPAIALYLDVGGKAVVLAGWPVIPPAPFLQ